VTRARPVAVLADPHAPFRTYVRPLLQEVVAGVHEATTAAETLRLVHAHAPDVVFLDIELDGPALARQIKCERPSTHVVLMTGHGEEAYLSATGKTGSDAVLPKAQLRTRLAPLLASLLRATGLALWDGQERRDPNDVERRRLPERRRPRRDQE
jgi:DNA-binding NarL/FixJ family response regulator